MSALELFDGRRHGLHVVIAAGEEIFIGALVAGISRVEGGIDFFGRKYANVLGENRIQHFHVV